MGMRLADWAPMAWDMLAVGDLTLYNYQLKFNKHIAPVMGDRDIASITRKEVQLWVLSLSPSVGKACLPVLSSLMNQACIYEMIPANPCLGVKKKKHTSPRRDFSSLEDLEMITPQRYLPPILFVAKHGLRASEAYALTAVDIERAEETGLLTINKTIYGQSTKSGHARSVPYMDNYARLPISRQFRTCLHPYTFHSLRKTYAYWLKTKGVHITTIQKLLGHAHIQTTMIYLNSLDVEVLEVGQLLRESA